MKLFALLFPPSSFSECAAVDGKAFYCMHIILSFIFLMSVFLPAFPSVLLPVKCFVWLPPCLPGTFLRVTVLNQLLHCPDTVGSSRFPLCTLFRAGCACWFLCSTKLSTHRCWIKKKNCWKCWEKMLDKCWKKLWINVKSEKNAG